MTGIHYSDSIPFHTYYDVYVGKRKGIKGSSSTQKDKKENDVVPQSIWLVFSKLSKGQVDAVRGKEIGQANIVGDERSDGTQGTTSFISSDK